MEDVSGPAPQKKSSSRWIIIVIVVVVVCCLCAALVGAGWWLWENGDELLEDWGLTYQLITPFI